MLRTCLIITLLTSLSSMSWSTSVDNSVCSTDSDCACKKGQGKPTCIQLQASCTCVKKKAPNPRSAAVANPGQTNEQRFDN